MLEKEGLIWEVRDDSYIVTPAGASLANLAMPAVERDKQRFFYLNRRRKFEVDA